MDEVADSLSEGVAEVEVDSVFVEVALDDCVLVAELEGVMDMLEETVPVVVWVFESDVVTVAENDRIAVDVKVADVEVDWDSL